MANILIAIFGLGLTLTTTGWLGTAGVLPLGQLTGIKQDVEKTFTDLTTGQIKLSLLPTGHNSRLDADFLDGLHATSFALQAALDEFSRDTSDKLTSLETQIGDLGGSLRTGTLAAFFQDATNLVTGTLSDLRLSAKVALTNVSKTFTELQTFTSGLTVSGGVLTLPTGSVTSTFIADQTIAGADLASNISLSTTGNLTTTGSGLITSAGLLTAGNGFTLSSGALTLPSSAISDSSLSSNVALLDATQTISGAKTFSSAITGPTSSNTLNGLVISSGNVTLANLTTSTGFLTSTVADSGTAAGFVLGTSTSYVTAGAKLLQIKNNTTEKLSLDKDGLLTINGNLVATGTVSGTQLISTVSTGTAPLIVSSTTQVANLNASLLEGNTSSTLMSYPQPNLVLNSDFGRRNKWMTFMPETFTSGAGEPAGWTALQGTLGSVAGNILTAGTSGGAVWEVAAGLTTWMDGRRSAQFQATEINGTGTWLISTGPNATGSWTHFQNGTVWLDSTINFGFVATLNNWYWLELEVQGTTRIAKFYSCPVAATACAKSSATLQGTLTRNPGTAPGAGRMHLYAQTTTASKWGGLSAGDGGVYVEGWGPESWDVTFAGTKGGQAFGFNEAADSGPAGKQWTARVFLPKEDRDVQFKNLSSDGSVVPSTNYIGSMYARQVSIGSGTAGYRFFLSLANSAGTDVFGNKIIDVASGDSTSFTRRTIVNTPMSSATARRTKVDSNVLAGSSFTNWTFEFLLPQIEQGSIVTPWRNASSDFEDILWTRNLFEDRSSGYSIAANASWQEINPSLSAAGIFLPWDARVEIGFSAGATNDSFALNLRGTIDGTAQAASYNKVVGVSIEPIFLIPVPSSGGNFDGTTSALGAGKHRIAIEQLHNSGTLTIYTAPRAVFWVVARRGK